MTKEDLLTQELKSLRKKNQQLKETVKILQLEIKKKKTKKLRQAYLSMMMSTNKKFHFITQ
uniref:Uncharacterized protein n=1 Tax=Lepeophtheirus salmonis TaxID=72036 RepID=A0A0K2TJP1_LEPSM